MPVPVDMKKWIDEASYTQLLSRWRFAPAGSPWFIGETGEYYAKIMKQKGNQIGNNAQVAASKTVGWEE